MVGGLPSASAPIQCSHQTQRRSRRRILHSIIESSQEGKGMEKEKMQMRREGRGSRGGAPGSATRRLDGGVAAAAVQRRCRNAEVAATGIWLVRRGGGGKFPAARRWGTSGGRWAARQAAVATAVRSTGRRQQWGIEAVCGWGAGVRCMRVLPLAEAGADLGYRI
jgi:hypothetical protein